MNNINVKSIVEWFNISKPKPTNQDLIKQIAFHVEEFSEMLEAIHCDSMVKKSKAFKKELLELSEDKEKSDNFVSSIDRVKLLDACADQVVTSTGVATFANMNFQDALIEVNKSNYTKFATDSSGDYVPYIKKDGKIGKNPDTYVEPELEQFV